MKKPAFAAALVVAILVLAGCSSPSNADVKSACEKKVGQAVVSDWKKTHADPPWDVVDVKSAEIRKNSQGTKHVHVFDVAGSASVQVNESVSKSQSVSWTCFAQYVDDGGDTTIAAAINRVSFG
jgi:hypothetical protein